MTEAMAEVIPLKRKVKVLCFFEYRKFGHASGNVYRKAGSKMIEVLSSKDIFKVWEEAMSDEYRRLPPWQRQNFSCWRLTKYITENGLKTF